MKIVIPILAMSAMIASNGVGWSAETATGSLGVKLEFARECKIDPGAKGLLLDFGRHLTLANVAEKENIEAEAIFEVQCTLGVAYNIYIDSGKNTPVSGVSAERKMSNGKDAFIDYGIYHRDNLGSEYLVGTKGMPKERAQAGGITVITSVAGKEETITVDGINERSHRTKGGMILSDYMGIHSELSKGDIEQYTVIGRVLKPKNGFLDLPTGTYSDTLRVTVSF